MEATKRADSRDGAHEPDLHATLCAAIVKRSMVMFEYGDLVRVVEPYRYGVNSADHAILSGWLRAGYSRSDPAGGWRNYLRSEIRALQVLDAPFAGTRPGYSAHDDRMREVFAELTPTAMEMPLEAPLPARESRRSIRSPRSTNVVWGAGEVPCAPPRAASSPRPVRCLPPLHAGRPSVAH